MYEWRYRTIYKDFTKESKYLCIYMITGKKADTPGNVCAHCVLHSSPELNIFWVTIDLFRTDG